MRVADLLLTLKKESSKWVKAEHPSLGSFFWQKGYGAFSVSPQFLDSLTQYIDHQEEHHKTVVFQDEMRALFKRYNVQYDERYVWD